MQKLGKYSAKQYGAAMLMFMLIIVIVGLSAILYFLNSSNIKNQRMNKTYTALSEAKTALIGFAIQHATKPGTLPCTDNNNNGSADNSGTNACAAYIGRLPWKQQLGMPMLKDANGECLWYALSPIFRERMTTTTRSANPLNSLTNGTISIVDDLGTPIASANPVIAVVIAPNNPVSGQNRSGAATTYCPGDSFAAKYLDAKGGVDNATGNVAGVSYTFKKGITDNGFNDQLVYITARDLYPSLRKRITNEIVGNPSPLAVPSGLVKYYQTQGGTYPCPAQTITGNANCAMPLGNFVPYNDTTKPLQYTALGTWLEDNQWFSMTTYTYVSSTHVKVKVSDSLGSYTCDANMNVVSCSAP